MVSEHNREKVSERFVMDFNMNLIANGFTSAWMREMFPENTEDKINRIFLMFERLGFSGKEAAMAVTKAAAEFNRNKENAKTDGWPLKYPTGVTEDFTEPEAYFIEQLAGTVMDMRQRMTQRGAV